MKLSYVVGSILLVSSLSAKALTVYKSEDNKTNLAVFGKVEAGVYNQFAKDEGRREKITIEGEGRIGISARSEIVNNFNAIAFAEWDVAAQTKDNGKFDTRYAYTGFDLNQYGALVFGQGDTAQYIAVGFVDVFEHWGAEANDYWLLGGRQESQAMYSVSVGNYTITGSYSLQNKTDNTYFDHDNLTHENFKLNIDRGYALGANYNWTEGFLKDVAIAGTYSWYRLDRVSTTGNKHSFNLALSYGHLGDGLYTALLYTRSKFTDEIHHSTGFDVVGGYGFDNGLGFMLGYGHYGYHFDRHIESYALGQVYYNFTSSLKVSAETKVGVGKLDYPKKDTDQHTKYIISLIYTF
ncbi:MAG: hypothetical protein UHG91_00970 [Succinivibrionaceae bacterium]|nr:hypothetical protein [Succinivibrionaceae bacterium]